MNYRKLWKRTRIDQLALTRTQSFTLWSYCWTTYNKNANVGSKAFFECVNRLAYRFMLKTGTPRQQITGAMLAEFAYRHNTRSTRSCQ